MIRYLSLLTFILNLNMVRSARLYAGQSRFFWRNTFYLWLSSILSSWKDSWLFRKFGTSFNHQWESWRICISFHKNQSIRREGNFSTWSINSWQTQATNQSKNCSHFYLKRLHFPSFRYFKSGFTLVNLTILSENFWL